MFPSLSIVIISFSILSLPLIQAQFVASLPQCVQDCIDDSQDENCKVTDIKCLCRASAENFLTDLVNCVHQDCDNDLDNNLLLAPLQLACQLAGTPIPDSALRNAENEASSLATQVTMTVTVGGSSASQETTTVKGPPGPPGPPGQPRLSTVTVTTTRSGTTIYQIWPITILSTTTISGPPSTRTVSDSPKSTSTSVNSSPIRSSDGGNSDTTTTTSVAAQETSSGPRSSIGSKTPKASSPGQTDSAPFTDTNGGTSRVRGGVRRLWFGVLVPVMWGLL